MLNKDNRLLLNKIFVCMNSISFVLFFLNGCVNVQKEDTYFENVDAITRNNLDIMDQALFGDNRFFFVSDVTGDAFDFNDLSDCYYAVIDVNDYNNYDFLNFLPNLEFLTIIDSSTKNKLSCVNGFNFKKKIKINIISSYSDAPFNEERYGFLKDIPYIDLLSLGVEDKTTNVDYAFLQCLRNVHNLKLFLFYFLNTTIEPSPFTRYPFFNRSFSILNLIFSYSNSSSLELNFFVT